ncbi:MAG: hypothetical protein Q8L89_03670 [Gammaproteobacteria bacterium]|nr:hypothetical protein [Gammaproteobacteria bacterium]
MMAATFITDSTIRASETPAARIAVSSLPAASVPKPSMVPSKAASGNNS